MKRLTATALVIAAMVLGGGCDFLKSSGPEGGVSPFISDLRLSNSTVPCGRDFLISFQYSDPQEDIEFMRVNFEHEDGETSFVVEVFWETGGGLIPEEEDEDAVPVEDEEEIEELFGGDLDLSVPGQASYKYRFECDTGKPRGTYSITVQLVDSKGHESNTRTDTISLSTN